MNKNQYYKNKTKKINTLNHYHEPISTYLLSEFDRLPFEMCIEERLLHWYYTGFKNSHGEWQINKCDICKNYTSTVYELRTTNENMVFVDERCMNEMIKKGMKNIK